MFSDKAFQEWGKKNAILFASVMTRIEGREHDSLLRTYGFRGFPSMAILDAEGTALIKRINRDLYSMKNVVESAPSYAALKAKVDAGEDVDATAWYLARLGVGQLDAKAAKEGYADLELTDEQRAKADQQLFVMEMSQLSASARPRRGQRMSAEEREAKNAELMAQVYAAYKDGKRLPAGCSPEQWVDQMLLEASEKNEDRDAFLYVYDRVRAAMQKQIAQSEGRLELFEGLIDQQSDENQKKRYQAALDSTRKSIATTREKIDELDARKKGSK